MASPPLASPLAFRCTECGNCCRNLRVAVTTHDVDRLATALDRPPHELVTWLAPDAVDMSGEPDGFVELAEGRRLMVLLQRGGACVLLGEDNRCGAYAARPRDCRLFPFDFDQGELSEPTARRLTLLPLNDCDYAADGAHDRTTLAHEEEQRRAELLQHRALVAQWNRLAWHRRRLHQRVGSAVDFLSFALDRVERASGSVSPR